MIFEVTNTMTLNDFVIACLRILYRKPVTLVSLGLCVMCIIFMLTGVVSSTNDSTTYYVAWFIIASNIFAPVADTLVARRNYLSNKALQHKNIYTFNDERISFKGSGVEGQVEWRYITKYVKIKHFILLYIAAKQAMFIKTDTLTPGQIAFIQSKIKQP